MDPREPIENAPDPAQKSRFFRWLDNYWYHFGNDRGLLRAMLLAGIL